MANQGTARNGHPGPRNAITDIDGLRVGHSHDPAVNTGVTVILPDRLVAASVDVRGGGPGTRETDALDPERLVGGLNALVLSGGSVYGLGAADAVAAVLGAAGTGYALVPSPGVPVSPIVPAAILYDLANGGNKAWGEAPPYARLGREALADAQGAGGRDAAIGRIGAGYGARAGAWPGGLGTASFVTADGITVGAIVAVNAFGSPYIPGTTCFWAWPFEQGGEFGGVRPAGSEAAQGFPDDTKLGPVSAAGGAGAATPGANTTICAVATDAALSTADCKRLAIMAQDGLSRALRPAHAPVDGDTVFALSTGATPLPEPRALSLTVLGNHAADCLARAIARGVYAASGA
ncbi:P1 family peptidase [Aquisalinus flavus]|uniref:Peptidase T4 n=1 Tax=Aquisalinus flavus TaxID=1526572 RepID=A0A8J2V551_9PROT|nr:P1 family peptidase [Aquisalinus flavus]MBD0426446.1 P1 family peptidase [Aquisalinus flavus]UNE48000.1 P1 family peptidase [Aquisalinus flavus]GGD07853.1 peptidase T4 [Aquisalinus flavus]